MGVDDNQNGISNLLGVSLKEFQKGEGETKNLLFGANPLYFEKNPEILEKISQKVHSLASEISDAEKIDFFTGTWSNYRNLVGGRLEGWTSNFQNRLELYKTHLVDVYDEIIPEKTIQKKGEHLDLLYQLIEKLAYFQNAGLPKDRENSFPKGNS